MSKQKIINPLKSFRMIPYISTREGGRHTTWLGKASQLTDAAEIAKYLRQSTTLLASAGLEKNSQGNGINDYPHICTDGVWIWVLTLAHWVENGGVPLPEEFIERVRELNYVPDPATIGALQGCQIDPIFQECFDPEFEIPEEFR